MRIRDWSSDGCSSERQQRHDDAADDDADLQQRARLLIEPGRGVVQVGLALVVDRLPPLRRQPAGVVLAPARLLAGHVDAAKQGEDDPREDKAVVAHLRQGENAPRSEEHTSELQSLMRISYAVFCLKQKKK